jgi:hypothetical protein
MTAAERRGVEMARHCLDVFMQVRGWTDTYTH